MQVCEFLQSVTTRKKTIVTTTPTTFNLIERDARGENPAKSKKGFSFVKTCTEGLLYILNRWLKLSAITLKAQ